MRTGVTGLSGVSRVSGVRRLYSLYILYKTPAPLHEEPVEVLWPDHRGERVLPQILGVDHEGVELFGGEAAVGAELPGKGDDAAGCRGGPEQDDVPSAAHAQ